MESTSTLKMFSDFQKFIEADQEIREIIKTAVRDLEQLAREILAIMQSVHHKATDDNMQKICVSTREKIPQVVKKIHVLVDKIPEGQYYRFHDHWRFVFQRLVFLMAFLVYLETEELICREDAASMLQVKVDSKEGFHLDLDDYLMGILQLASELSRMCVNSVIAGDYEKPNKIASFLTDLDAAFRLLNLKNDALRKRFDALKYDLKKVEEVVYDLSIRGLKQK